ncbi:hypothetical protein [Flavonifractor sp. An100]|uniref:hypothetical protein n=1 Tax=Flavonifractor sp. An100 TaxID=1965538 RepID=UPI00130234E1|nr:hypothetical protein [Flavonifractor sp. An100]
MKNIFAASRYEKCSFNSAWELNERKKSRLISLAHAVELLYHFGGEKHQAAHGKSAHQAAPGHDLQLFYCWKLFMLFGKRQVGIRHSLRNLDI